MELREYINIITRWGWVIIAVTVISTVIAGIMSYVYLEKEFESTTTIIIRSQKTEVENGKVISYNLPADENMIKVYTTLAQSDAVIDEVILDLKLNINANELRKEIKVAQYEDTGIIKITVLDKSAQNAQSIVNSILANLKNESVKINLLGSINIIDKAKIPVLPVKPRSVLNIFISAVAGIMAGIILVALIESLDNSLNSLQLLQKISQVPILGYIPKIRISIKNKYFNSNVNIIKSNEENYKILRTRVNSICRDNSVKVILVTSPSYNEGKTTISINLAATMGQLGKKVLLVDCNFRDVKLYKKLKLLDEEGLSNYLADKDELIFKTSTIPEANIQIISSGMKPANPVELLESKRMSKFINNMRERFDVIIIDSPPILPLADAAILSKLVDGVLLVVKFRSSKYEMISKAVQTLNNFNTNILGIVVNQITSKKQYI